MRIRDKRFGAKIVLTVGLSAFWWMVATAPTPEIQTEAPKAIVKYEVKPEVKKAKPTKEEKAIAKFKDKYPNVVSVVNAEMVIITVEKSFISADDIDNMLLFNGVDFTGKIVSIVSQEEDGRELARLQDGKIFDYTTGGVR